MKISFSFLSVAFFILFSAEKLFAQNLVPNPSFENLSDCPWLDSQIYFALGWSSYLGSADYYNACDTAGLHYYGVPINNFGNQEASNGDAYAGIATFSNPSEYREFLGTQLTQSLAIGQKYFVSFKVSLADICDCSSNNIGVLFSTIPYSDTAAPASINNIAMVYNPSIISDSLNWTEISGSFISDSAYSYIMIGNFFNDNLTLHTSCNVYSAYYYIDDVCVSPDSLECDLNPEGIYNLPQQQIAIYPNPATQQFIIDNGQLIIKGIEMFDLLGRKMMDDDLLADNSNHYSLNTKNFPRGYYFIRINTSEGMINRNIILQ